MKGFKQIEQQILSQSHATPR